MTDVLADRCEQVRQTVLELTQTVIESLGAPAKLGRVTPLLSHLRSIVHLGTDGIDDPAYLAWARAAAGNLDRMEEAALAGDAKATYAAFADQESGVALLGTACAGKPGW
ncbi:hypothetical protein ELQ92_03580 [Labedella populi]|uniref:Uncharacterized protein n=1 Tax=Labedella populi TaxID=2498850 RepID=A0A444QFG8_9MICO|nr:hypothetical protein [Labedella populi]RWZ68311.1 hypothetical protein ELQ92_03580 [Labedella populi]